LDHNYDNLAVTGNNTDSGHCTHPCYSMHSQTKHEKRIINLEMDIMTSYGH